MLCVTSSSFAKWSCPLFTGLRLVLRSVERRLLLRLRGAPVHLQLEFLHELGLFRFSRRRAQCGSGCTVAGVQWYTEVFCAGATQRARPRCTSGLLTVCSSPWWVLVYAQLPHCLRSCTFSTSSRVQLPQHTNILSAELLPRISRHCEWLRWCQGSLWILRCPGGWSLGRKLPSS